MLTGLSVTVLKLQLTTNKDMTVAIQACGIVALLFVGLLVLFAFMDAHGWFNVSTRTTSVPYLIRLSTLRAEMNYWGATTLMELCEAVSLNLNRTVEFVDDEIRCSPEDSEFDRRVSEVSFLRGLSKSVIMEFLKEAGR